MLRNLGQRSFSEEAAHRNQTAGVSDGVERALDELWLGTQSGERQHEPIVGVGVVLKAVTCLECERHAPWHDELSVGVGWADVFR